MNHATTVLVGLAAAVAALLYLIRQMIRLAGAVRFIAALPAEHAKLLKATASNTEAIRELTVQVMHLSEIEQVRAEGDKP